MTRPEACATHAPQINAWLDHRGPLHHHQTLGMIGDNSNTIPSWTKTHQILKAQIDALRDEHVRNCDKEAS